MAVTITLEAEKMELVIQLLETCEKAMREAIEEKTTLIVMTEMVMKMNNKKSSLDPQVKELQDRAAAFMPDVKNQVKQNEQKLEMLVSILNELSPERELEFNNPE